MGRRKGDGGLGHAEGRQGHASSSARVGDRWFLENRRRAGASPRRRKTRRQVSPCELAASLRLDSIWRGTTMIEPIDLQRHRHPTHAGHARRHARRRGRRRRLRRRPDRQPPRGTRRGPARQGGGPVRAVGHHVEPDLRQGATPSPATSCSARPTATSTTYEAGGPAVLSGVTCRTLDGDYGILDVSQFEDKIRPRQRSPGAHPAGLPGKHAQPRRRPGLPAGEDPGHQRLGAAARPGHAPRRRPAVERRRRHRHCRRRVGAAISTPSRSASARGWARRSDRPWPGHATSSRGPGGSASCSAAACVRPACWPRRPCTPWITTSTAWPRTTATPSVIAQAIADTPGLRLDPPEVETNLIWFEVDPELGTAGRGGSPEGARRAGASYGAACSAPARISMSRRRRPNTQPQPFARQRRQLAGMK